MNSNVINKKSKRIKSIDIIRGLSVALMIICNNPGVNRGYVQLSHAPWHGVTLADFGFPFFMICMGVAIPISIDSKIKRNNSNTSIVFGIVKRSLLMILFGLFLNYLSNPDFTTIRVMGVLQRLGITYLIGAITYLIFKRLLERNSLVIWALSIISVFIVMGYYKVSSTYGFEMEGSLAQVVDMMLLKGHLYKPDFDPEGLLTTLVSTSSVLIGAVVGCIINDKNKDENNKFISLLSIGIALIIASIVFNKYVPFNKRLWSSSFILLMGGSFSLMLSIFYYICDIKNKYKIFTPIIALGSSPIFTYMALEIISKTIWKINMVSSIEPYNVGFRTWVTYEFITPWAGTYYDSLVFSLGYLGLWMIVMLIMYKKNIFIKI